jgi:hypothetical protein
MAHAAFFLDLAESSVPHLLAAVQLEWDRRLVAEQDSCQPREGYS